MPQGKFERPTARRAVSGASTISVSRPLMCAASTRGVTSLSPLPFSGHSSTYPAPLTSLPPVHIRRQSQQQSCASGPANDTDSRCQPISIDFEYRAVVVGTAHVVMDVRDFRPLCKPQPSDAEIKVLPKIVDEVIHELKIDRIAVQHRKDLLRILTARKNDHAVKKFQPEAALIVAAGKQAKHFEILTTTLVARLQNCFELHVKRYFLSYAQEPDANEIPAVLNYQDYIRKNSDFIVAKICAIEEDLIEYKSLQETFLSNYLENLRAALDIIERVCGAALKICGTLKQWVYRDKDYAKRLWDYIITTNMVRGKVLEDVRRCNRKKSELSLQIARREETRQQASRHLEQRRQEGQRVQMTRERLTSKLTLTQEDLKVSSNHLEEVRNQFTNRTSNSPKYLEALSRKVETLEAEVATLEARQVALQRQIGKLTSTCTTITMEEEMSDNMVDCGSSSVLKEQLQEVVVNLEHLEREAGHLEERVSVARHIRGLKVSSAHLRKLCHQYNQAVPAV